MRTNNKITFIEILDNVLDPEYWSWRAPHKHHTCHIYYANPYEADDDCSTCDGARCAQCHEYYDEEDLELAITTEKLYEILLSKNIPSNIANELAYSDTARIYKGYYLVWPSGEDLKSKYPDKYDSFVKIHKDKKEL